MAKLDKAQKEWAKGQAETIFEIATEGEGAYIQEVNGHQIPIQFIINVVNGHGTEIKKRMCDEIIKDMEKNIAWFIKGTSLSYTPAMMDYADEYIAEKVEIEWKKANPVKCVPSHTIYIGGVQLSGNLNELKDFASEIRNLQDETSSELSGSISDALFSIEMSYRTYHELDNWDKIHE